MFLTSQPQQMVFSSARSQEHGDLAAEVNHRVRPQAADIPSAAPMPPLSRAQKGGPVAHYTITTDNGFSLADKHKKKRYNPRGTRRVKFNIFKSE